MVGILVSFWNGLFSGAMLVSGGVGIHLKVPFNPEFQGLRMTQINTELGLLAITSCGLFPNTIRLVGKVRTTAIATFAARSTHWRLHVYLRHSNEEPLRKNKSCLIRYQHRIPVVRVTPKPKQQTKIITKSSGPVSPAVLLGNFTPYLP